MSFSSTVTKKGVRPGALALVFAVLLSIVAIGWPSSPARAAGALLCTGTNIYGVVPSGSATPGSTTLLSVDGASVGNAQLDASVEATSTIAAANANGLGITPGGLSAYIASESGTVIQRYDAVSGTWTSHQGTAAGVSSINVGAIDPTNGIFYFGGVNPGELYGFDTNTNTLISESPLLTFPAVTGQASGDIAFDGSGNLYIVTSSPTDGTLRAIGGPLPATAAQAAAFTPVELSTFATPGGENVGGIAFDATGTLYLSLPGTTGIFSIDPGTGNARGTLTPLDPSLVGPDARGIYDLASCAFPPTVSAQKNVVSRVNPTDQFALEVTGPTVTFPATATTAGTATGLQQTADGRVLQAGPALARIGDTYTVTETAAGTTDLSQYLSSYSCVDTANPSNPEFPITGTGTTASFNLDPFSGEAPSVLCTFTNEARTPALTMTKTANPASVTLPGDAVDYTYTVTNSGNTPLTAIAVSESSFSGTGTAPVPNCPTTALAPAESVQCTASYAATATDIAAGSIINTAFATGQDAVAGTITSPDATAVVAVTAAPSLSLEKTADPATITAAGQTISYAFLVTNTGNVPLTGVAIDEQTFTGAGGTPAVDCPANSDLAAGASLTCTAAYQVTAADLTATGISNTAAAAATDPTGATIRSASSTAEVELAVAAAPTPTPTPAPSAPAVPAATPPLASTGSTIAMWLAPLAGLLALAGIGIAIVAARRRTAKSTH